MVLKPQNGGGWYYADFITIFAFFRSEESKGRKSPRHAYTTDKRTICGERLARNPTNQRCTSSKRIIIINPRSLRGAPHQPRTCFLPSWCWLHVRRTNHSILCYDSETEATAEGLECLEVVKPKSEEYPHLKKSHHVKSYLQYLQIYVRILLSSVTTRQHRCVSALK